MTNIYCWFTHFLNKLILYSTVTGRVGHSFRWCSVKCITLNKLSKLNTQYHCIYFE